MADRVYKRKLTDLTPDNRNANKGTVRGLAMLEDSLRDYGAGRSILVDKNNRVIAGNKTLESAADIGIEDALVIPTDGKQLVVVQRTDIDLDTPRGRALAVADNRVGEVDLAWSGEALQGLLDDGVDLSRFFDQDELDALLAAVGADDTPGTDPGPQMDRAAELQAKWQVKRGDLWTIGNHRLLCGDSTNADDVARVMGGERAQLMVNDPPYGMRLDADFSEMKSGLKFAKDKGAFGGRKYDNVIGDHVDYDAQPILKIFKDVPEQFWFGADYYSATLGDTMHCGAWLVWDKRLDESADKMYGSCFELIWSRQRHKRDILRFKWAGVFGTEQEPEKARFHPNQKPSVLLSEIIEQYSETGDLVVDCYGGSGTTLVACEQTGRRGRAIEIEPKYVAVALERLAGLGLEPRREA